MTDLPDVQVRDDLEEAFWSRVERNPNGCWEWTAATTSRLGYGAFHLGYKDGKQKQEYAHRVSYMMHCGPIPDGMQVCHHCDNPKCVRPDHLFLGTAKDNTQDMIRKGRKALNFGPKGPRRPHSTLGNLGRFLDRHGLNAAELSEQIGSQVHRLYRFIDRAEGIGSRALAAFADLYGTSETLWVFGKLPPQKPTTITPCRKSKHCIVAWKLDPETATAIKTEYVPGEITLREVGAKYGVSYEMVRLIVKGISWNGEAHQ